MSEDNRQQPYYFFRIYRRFWLALVVVTFIAMPVAMAGIFGMLPGFSAALGLLIYLALFGLHLTMFVAGRWDPHKGPTGIRTRKQGAGDATQ